MTIVAIIGKQNVGKSTIFNRLTSGRTAITSKIAGTTRDRIVKNMMIDGKEILLVDTGGVTFDNDENIEKQVTEQANLAVSEADIILFSVDLLSGITKEDYQVAEILRKSQKKIILLGNKSDNKKAQETQYDFYELGFGEPILVSAIHNTGIENLKKIITSCITHKKKTKKTKTEENGTRVCILGKPNAGKSSLVNAIANDARLIVSQTPGTTRDSIDIEITRDKDRYTFIDTAGLKKGFKKKGLLQRISELRAIDSIGKSDLAILLVDGEKKISIFDAHIVQDVLENKKGLIIAVNKSDIISKEERARMTRILSHRFAFVPWAPIIFLSAKTGENIEVIFELIKSFKEESGKRIDTHELNGFLQKTILKHKASSSKYIKPKFKYITQVGTNPPKFVIICRYPENTHFSYIRYLENAIRKEYGFNGTPIEIKFKKEVIQKPVK